MTRTRRLRLATSLAGALMTAVLGAGALGSTAGSAYAEAAPGDTPLPPGWELCVLQGVSAPVTQANVDDLDAWQAAEGGSTNNSAAYNPFNTRRTTDVTNATIPSTASGNGFPAFSSWADGCAATVATLLQVNMSSITAALQAGTVVPPDAFLATVDQSKWCAPSPDGTPCYTNQILGATGNLAAALLGNSSALLVYGNVQSDLHNYQQDIAATATDKGVLTARNAELLSAQSHLSAAQEKLVAAQRALQQFAIDTYVSGGTYAGTSFMNLAGPKPFESQNTDGVIAQQYETIVASELDGRVRADVATAKAALANRDGAAKAVSLATATLASDDTAESHALARLVSDVATMQKAGACTTAVITVAAPVTPGSSAAGSGTSGTTSPTATTTTTSTPSAAAAAPTTTTTTVPPTTTTTSTVPTTVPAVKVPPITVPTTATTTTTAVPSTTVPSTPSSPSSTTTTTVPASSSGTKSTTTATPQTVNPAGLQVLQGCVSSLAPAPGH